MHSEPSAGLRRDTRRRGRRVALAVVAGSLLAAAPADANQIPGATYDGTHSGGGTIRFTVSADGSSVDSYRAAPVTGNTCIFVAQGDKGEWPGAPILANAFSYRLYDAILFAGTFPASQSASGTLKLFNSAVPGVKPACDSGTVTWTATTQATAPAPGTPGTPGTQPPAVVPRPIGPPIAERRVYRTTVLVRKPGPKRLIGRVTSLGAGCASGRTVTLKRGLNTLAKTTSGADGTFRFTRTKKLRGFKIRLTVSASRRTTLSCAAGSSKTVRLPKR